MYLFSIVPPVLCWLSLNMGALPLAEGSGGTRPLLLGAKLGTWEIPFVNPFMVHALCHIGAYLVAIALPAPCSGPGGPHRRRTPPPLSHAAVTFVRDLDAVKAGAMPQWYKKLRVPLAFCAVGSIVAAMAVIGTTCVPRLPRPSPLAHANLPLPQTRGCCGGRLRAQAVLPAP